MEIGNKTTLPGTDIDQPINPQELDTETSLASELKKGKY